jgi:transcriptional regulator NrdR family protein
MKCPQCNAWSQVLRTKNNQRRRECANGHRFSTQEVVIEDTPHGGDRHSAAFKQRKEACLNVTSERR